MTESTRAAGWYPDPWGTEGERYFDGGAWGRETRPVGGVAEPEGAAAAWPAPTVTPAVLPSDDAVVPAGMADSAAVAPAGWHPDPWRLAAVRWWDGSRWTGHVSGPPATAERPIDVPAERARARWLRPLLLVAGIASAVSQVGSVNQIQWVGDHWDALMKGQTTTDKMPAPPAGLVGAVSQVASLVGIAVVVLFLLWFYRASANAWAAGMPMRRSPILATLSFLIPVLNLWWPLQSTLDLVPADTPNRRLIGWWWVSWLLAGLCGLAALPVAIAYGQDATRVVAVVGGVAIVVAGVLAGTVVEYVTRTHEAAALGAAG